MLDETEELELIRSVLVDAFPEESRRVGMTNLHDIVRRRGRVRVVPLSGASRLEWTDSLVLLASSATLLGQWLIAARSSSGSKDRGKAEWHIHFDQTVTQNLRVDNVRASQVSVGNRSEFTVPSEIADKLDSAALDRLVSSFVAHLDTARGQGSRSDEPQ